MNKSFTEILKGLPLTDGVKQALQGESNELREMLDFVIGFEQGAWEKMKNLPLAGAISADRFMYFYMDALKWAKNITSL